jgi:hypothetical protein
MTASADVLRSVFVKDEKRRSALSDDESGNDSDSVSVARARRKYSQSATGPTPVISDVDSGMIASTESSLHMPSGDEAEKKEAPVPPPTDTVTSPASTAVPSTPTPALDNVIGDQVLVDEPEEISSEIGLDPTVVDAATETQPEKTPQVEKPPSSTPTQPVTQNTLDSGSRSSSRSSSPAPQSSSRGPPIQTNTLPPPDVHLRDLAPPLSAVQEAEEPISPAVLRTLPTVQEVVPPPAPVTPPPELSKEEDKKVESEELSEGSYERISNVPTYGKDTKKSQVDEEPPAYQPSDEVLRSPPTDTKVPPLVENTASSQPVASTSAPTTAPPQQMNSPQASAPEVQSPTPILPPSFTSLHAVSSREEYSRTNSIEIGGQR